MAKRTRKPPIPSEKRQEWLKRHEETGESLPQIAQKDHFDIRTVRKQVQLAQDQREAREARLLVLRAAVEHHYDDLLKYVESLDPEFKGDVGLRPQDHEFLELALREHLPRSPIWGHLARYRQLNQECQEQRQAIKKALKEMLAADSQLPAMAKTGIDIDGANLAEALVFKTAQWSQGIDGINPKINLVSEAGQGGNVRIRYGAFPIATVHGDLATDAIKNVRELLTDLESRLKKSPEYYSLEKTASDIRLVERKLREELVILRLRRIMPGRCKYCPL